MALARSASGPGGLSINTSSANSLFGSTSTNQPPASGSLFGSSKPPAAGGLFGSTTAATSAPPAQGVLSAPQTSQPSANLFGGGINTTSTTQGGASLFGSATVSSQPQQGAGLFGSSTTTTQAPQQAGSLFGSLNNSSQPQQGGGLFGNMANQPTQNQKGTTTGAFGNAPGPLFGGTTNTAFGSTPGPLFGGLNNQNQNKPAGFSFGGSNNNQNQQQHQSGTSFPFLNQQAKSATNVYGTSFGGGLKLGQSSEPTVSGVRIDVSLMKGTTRFNDLHDEIQKRIGDIDNIILAQQGISKECNAIVPSHDTQLSSVPVDVDFVSRKLIGVESSLGTDAEAIAFVGQLIKQDAENAKLSFKAIDNLRLPPQYHQGNWISTSSGQPSSQGQDSSDPQDLISFFSQTSDEMSATLTRYQNHISEIELHLRTVEAATVIQAQQMNTQGGFSDDVDDQKRELAAVLREFEAGIRSVASVVAETREGVQRLQLGTFGSNCDTSGAGRAKRSGIY